MSVVFPPAPTITITRSSGSINICNGCGAMLIAMGDGRCV
ncbi:hypothetical protein DSUL_40099 [Desulfovibrionales bacterium]